MNTKIKEMLKRIFIGVLFVIMIVFLVLIGVYAFGTKDILFGVVIVFWVLVLVDIMRTWTKYK